MTRRNRVSDFLNLRRPVTLRYQYGRRAGRRDEMQAFSLKCFGVGDGWPCADRNHAAFLYRFGQTTILVDCGEGLSRSYKASGLSYDTVDRILLSHLHADHIGGFSMFLQGLWLERRRKELWVHLPAGGIRPLRRMLSAAAIFDELLGFRLCFEPLRSAKLVRAGKVRVTPFLTSHLDELRAAFRKQYRHKFVSYCFLLESGGRRVGHSADIGRPEDLAPLLEKPLDLLVCELAHATPRELFAYLRGRDIKHIVFVHLARPYWERLKQTRQLAAKMLPRIRVTFASDGQEIRL
jgi:ribonuclease BN (tRNA processing enzyme)